MISINIQFKLRLFSDFLIIVKKKAKNSLSISTSQSSITSSDLTLNEGQINT